ncbi:MAG: Ig-like domain repeat protein [Frankiales bacterium]|nr:Ig-like domain repeat protein [Frankiales bacterium]
MQGTFRARARRIVQGAVAAGAVMATATGCIWGNTSDNSLPANTTAATYPSTVSVGAGTGTFDPTGEGNVLDGMIAVLCGLRAPSALVTTNSVDAVLEGPAGGKVSLLSGFTGVLPHDVIVIDPTLYSYISGYVSSLNPTNISSVNPRKIFATPAARRHAIVVPNAQRNKVLKKLVHQFNKTTAHANVTAGSTPAPTLQLSDFAACLPSFALPSQLVIISTGASVLNSLPSPAPAAPYGTDLSGFLGSNPQGDWHLWVNSTGATTYNKPKFVFFPRPAHFINVPTPVPAGDLGSWFLLLASHNDIKKPFVDAGNFTATGDDSAATPVTLTMKVNHDQNIVNPTGQVDFIECTTPLCDGNTVGTAPLVPNGDGSSTATLTLPAGSVGAGEHKYKAVYYGDPNFDMLVAAPQSITVPGASS